MQKLNPQSLALFAISVPSTNFVQFKAPPLYHSVPSLGKHIAPPFLSVVRTKYKLQFLCTIEVSTKEIQNCTDFQIKYSPVFQRSGIQITKI